MVVLQIFIPVFGIYLLPVTGINGIIDNTVFSVTIV